LQAWDRCSSGAAGSCAVQPHEQTEGPTARTAFHASDKLPAHPSQARRRQHTHVRGVLRGALIRLLTCERGGFEHLTVSCGKAGYMTSDSTHSDVVHFAQRRCDGVARTHPSQEFVEVALDRFDGLLENQQHDDGNIQKAQPVEAIGVGHAQLSAQPPTAASAGVIQGRLR